MCVSYIYALYAFTMYMFNKYFEVIIMSITSYWWCTKEILLVPCGFVVVYSMTSTSCVVFTLLFHDSLEFDSWMKKRGKMTYSNVIYMTEAVLCFAFAIGAPAAKLLSHQQKEDIKISNQTLEQIEDIIENLTCIIM